MIGQLTFDKILGWMFTPTNLQIQKRQMGKHKNKAKHSIAFLFTRKAKQIIVQIGRNAPYQFTFQLMSYKTPTLIYRLRRFTLLLPGVIHHWPSSRTPRIQSRPFFCHPQCFIHEGVFLDPRAPLFVSFCRGARRGEAVRRSYRDNRCHQSHHDHHHQEEQNHDPHHLWL